MKLTRTARRVVAVGVAALALTLSSCSVTGGGGSKGEAGSGTGTINALFMKQAGYSESDIRQMISSFEKDNPEIKVKPTFVSYEALHDKIVTSAAAGTYDVELIDVIWPAEFASKGLITDVTDRFPDSWKKRCSAGPRTPRSTTTSTTACRGARRPSSSTTTPRCFQQVGATPADLNTWAGVLDVARKMKQQGISKYPISWSWAQAEALICDYAQILGAFGGSFTDDNGKLDVNNAAGVEALTWMKKTLDEGLTNPGSTTFLEDDVSKSMAQGDTAFSLNWDSTYRDLERPQHLQRSWARTACCPPRRDRPASGRV